MAWKQTAAFAAIASLAQLGQANEVQLQKRGAANIVMLPPCTSSFTPWVYEGCYFDAAAPHIFPFRSPQSTNDMTQELCIEECKGGNYRLAGLEFGGECYCGNVDASPKLDESSCSFPCNGDHSQKCGAGNVMSVFRDPTFETALSSGSVSDYHAIGCYSDNSNSGRALSEPIDLDQGSFTTEKCIQACFEAGWPYAGTEFAQECYCGNGVFNGGQLIDNSKCNMACNGNKNEICGGPGALSVYFAAKLDSSEHCGAAPVQAPPSSTSVPHLQPTPTHTSTTKSSTSTTSTYSSSSTYVPPPPPPSSSSSSSIYTPPPPPPTTYTPPPPPPTTYHSTTTSSTYSPPPPPPPSPTPTPSSIIPKSCPAYFKR